MAPKRKILLAEEDPRLRSQICNMFESLGYHVATAGDGSEALTHIRPDEYQVFLADFDLPGKSGIDLLKAVLDIDETIKVIYTSKRPAVEDAVESIKNGAMEFILKPLDLTQLRLVVEKLFDVEADLDPLTAANESPKVNIVSRNSAMLRLLELAKKIADSSASVFIQGESGTGKELFARFIHENSRRKNKPFVAVNCAALPETLLESELFGHEKGAFTGAVSKKPGKFEIADQGTILLDETTEMQLHLQSKLLRVIQERELDRVGGQHPIKVDVRVIATSNRDIQTTVEKGEFREDLYYRLNTIPIRIPPLRERPEDISLLAEHFIAKYNKLDGRNVKSLTKDAQEIIEHLPFKGNVRELENIIHRAVLLSDGEQIRREDLFIEDVALPPPSLSNNHQNQELVDALRPGPLKEVEKTLIFHTLGKANGNRTHAAKMLGISVRTLRNKLNEYKEQMDSV